MRKDDLKDRLNRGVDRRRFLQACGALGVGAIAGGIAQAKWDLVKLTGGLEKATRTRTAMGTFVSITAVNESRDRAQEAIGRAFEEMDRLIPVFNRFDSTSALSALNDTGRLAGAPPELGAVLQWAGRFHGATGGCFNVSVKPLLDLFDATVGRDGTYPRDDQIAEALSHVFDSAYRIGPDAIELTGAGAGITLDGIAKGFIVDAMSATMAEHGVADHLVNAGGDIRTSGRNASGDPWTIAVEDPGKHGRYPATIRMTDGAVATSGSYEVYYDRERVFHHIVDPRTGTSPHHNASATVRARSVMVADALSTALFVASQDRGLAMINELRPVYDTYAFVLDARGQAASSTGWDGRGA